MPSRRVLLQALGVGAVASASLGASSTADAVQDPSTWTSGLTPWWIVAPLTAGSALGRGWSLSHLSPVEDGATILTLSQRDGRIARVHICARQGDARGLASTERFDLILMDGGQGDCLTEEDLARVLRQLARHMRRSERDVGEDGLRMVAGLSSHGDRVARYGAEALV